jgi:uncharacterized membrane protein
MSSFPSVYYLLPRYFEATSEHDLFDIETWKKLKLGYLTKINDKEQFNFLKFQLERANEFYKKLGFVENTLYGKTKLIFINSHIYSTPTLFSFSSGNLLFQVIEAIYSMSPCACHY